MVGGASRPLKEKGGGLRAGKGNKNKLYNKCFPKLHP